MLALAARFWYVPVIGALVLALAALNGHASRLSRDLDVRTTERNAARTALAVSEAARVTDRKAATASYEGLQTTCTAGLALAVNRGRVIERIVSAPAPAGSVRVGASADQLRVIVGQAADPEGRPQ